MLFFPTSPKIAGKQIVVYYSALPVVQSPKLGSFSGIRFTVKHLDSRLLFAFRFIRMYPNFVSCKNIVYGFCTFSLTPINTSLFLRFTQIMRYSKRNSSHLNVFAKSIILQSVICQLTPLCL